MSNVILQSYDELIIEKAIHHIHEVGNGLVVKTFEDGTTYRLDSETGRYFKIQIP